MTLQILAIAIPTLAVLLAIWRSDKQHEITHRRIDDATTSVNKRIDDVNTRLLNIEAELRGFHETVGSHGARLNNLEQQRKAGSR